MSNGTSHSYYYYVYPLNINTGDSIYDLTNLGIGNGSFLSRMTTILATQGGYPSLTTITIDQLTLVKPELSSLDPQSATFVATQDSITLSNAALLTSGYVWAAAYNSLSFPNWTFTSMIDTSDFKYLLHASSGGHLGSTVVYTTGDEQVSVRINGLNSGTEYNIYWFGMSEDPGYQNATTLIYQRKVSTNNTAPLLRPDAILVVVISILSTIFS